MYFRNANKQAHKKLIILSIFKKLVFALPNLLGYHPTSGTNTFIINSEMNIVKQNEVQLKILRIINILST